MCWGGSKKAAEPPAPVLPPADDGKPDKETQDAIDKQKKKMAGMSGTLLTDPLGVPNEQVAQRQVLG